MIRGLLRWLWSLFSAPTLDADEEAYRCIQCGASFERDRTTCSECGGRFVVPTDDDDEPNPQTTGRPGP